MQNGDWQNAGARQVEDLSNTSTFSGSNAMGEMRRRRLSATDVDESGVFNRKATGWSVIQITDNNANASTSHLTPV
jgi:hypothetical protein